MRRILIPFAVTFALVALGADAAWAQCPTILDALEAVAPGITFKVVRDVSLGDNPSYCTPPPTVTCDFGYQGATAALPWECSAVNTPSLQTGLVIGVDAGGNTYDLAPPGAFCFPDGRSGFILERISPSGTTEVVARMYLVVQIASVFENFRFGGSFQFDSTNGRIVIPFASSAPPSNLFCPYQHYGVVEIGGLPKLFDTFLTFLPAGQSLTALTPGLPDGFRSADSLQAWTGDVHSLPDWSRAAPLVCDAATTPAAGQLVSIADSLPDPAVGQARYYVVASQSGTQRRLGRQYVNGAFTARDPSALPVCQ